MTHEKAFKELTAYIQKAVQINLQHGEQDLAYQKHILHSFAITLESRTIDYKKELEVLISMIQRSIEINREYKEYKQADQMILIYELARGLQDQANGGNSGKENSIIKLLN